MTFYFIKRGPYPLTPPWKSQLKKILSEEGERKEKKKKRKGVLCEYRFYFCLWGRCIVKQKTIAAEIDKYLSVPLGFRWRSFLLVLPISVFQQITGTTESHHEKKNCKTLSLQEKKNINLCKCNILLNKSMFKFSIRNIFEPHYKRQVLRFTGYSFILSCQFNNVYISSGWKEEGGLLLQNSILRRILKSRSPLESTVYVYRVLTDVLISFYLYLLFHLYLHV